MEPNPEEDNTPRNHDIRLVVAGCVIGSLCLELTRSLAESGAERQDIASSGAVALIGFVSAVYGLYGYAKKS